MSKINQAIHDIHYLDEMAERNTGLCRLHPLAKVIVTLSYVALTVSFDKYDLTGLAGMCLYPVVLMILGELPVRRALVQLRPVLLVVCLVGIANPFFDRIVLFHIAGIPVTGGVVSMLTLVFKAMFAVFASYLLIATTSIDNICCALRMLHVPKILVTLVMLIYRYIILMLKEAQRVTEAYSLRAPDEKGIRCKVWGTLAGQMLLRSMDRAQAVYESMALRGFTGEYSLKGMERGCGKSIRYAVIWCAALAGLRIFPLFETAGRMLGI
ncbi:hypothetical protein CE91St62_30870 [Lachnospiraceae bacterium]|uniref:cobalt ECF transporter T component CbiQ n=1 Tax=Extibacter sp. GGCC_0201 TaxID=2731209 RepID=UPI001AA0CB0B|nr:cobalt ECF transporter T component CbiQ [Extibacter sp. GGCC_0201]MBO1722587.1 cobalt ECF transporter T component CbiQ [Extibacter sp. GGCC_0201]BDF35025.1 hypothetical protein CE91St61_31000 [Lachnospiraceae bacterium]BDF39026.1 hypothetical protein CE91St62_30870 [Lachnospiraceae bacterium]